MRLYKKAMEIKTFFFWSFSIFEETPYDPFQRDMVV